MTVTIDQSSGFCWGVVRTVDIAEHELRRGEELYSLGEIIHNPQEIERLGKMGLKTVDAENMAALAGKKVLIRAHGEPPETYRNAERFGVALIDATCPVVTKLQERIKKYYDDGYQIVVFGKKTHAEIIALRGVCNEECIVAQSVEELGGAIDMGKKTVLFSQTTMDKRGFAAMKEFLQRSVEELILDSAEEIAVEFHAKDTICGQVSGREKKLRAFALQNDVVVFVAGRSSSNGKVLFGVCRDANARSYYIEHERELNPAWFANARSAGVTGATSTPLWLMLRVRNAILAANDANGND